MPAVVLRMKESACLVWIPSVSRKTKNSQTERQETTIARFATLKAITKVLVCRLDADTFFMSLAFSSTSSCDGVGPVSSSVSWTALSASRGSRLLTVQCCKMRLPLQWLLKMKSRRKLWIARNTKRLISIQTLKILRSPSIKIYKNFRCSNSLTTSVSSVNQPILEV